MDTEKSRLKRKIQALKTRRHENAEKIRKAMTNGDFNLIDRLEAFHEWLNKRIHKYEEKEKK